MPMVRFGFYQLLVSFGLLFCACAKEEPVYPQVRILAPAEGQSFRFGDTIVLEFALEQHKTYRYQVLDGGRPLGMEEVLLNSGPNRYRVHLYCTNPYLPSGAYQIQVRAENDKQVKSAFRQIRYQSFPRRRIGYATLNDQVLWLSDSSGGSGRTVALDQSAFDLAFRPPAQELILWAPQGSQLVGYDFSSAQRNFQASYPLPGQQAQYDALFAHPQAVYLAQADGQVYPLRQGGQAGPVRQLKHPWRCTAGLWREEALWLGLYNPARKEAKLHQYQGALGGLLQAHLIGAGQLRAMVALDNDRIFFCLEQGNTLKAGLYNTQSEQSTLFINLGQAQFKALESDAQGTVYLLTDEGLYRYRESVNNQPLKLALNQEPEDIFYDRVEHELLLLFPNNIKALTPQGTTVFRTAVLAGSKKMTLIYNK